MLKRVSLDRLPKLSGVIDGLAAEVLNDDSVEIYHLDRTGKGVKAEPFLYWKKGVVAERSSTRGMNLDYVLTLGRSKGLIVSKTLRVLVPYWLSRNSESVDLPVEGEDLQNYLS